MTELDPVRDGLIAFAKAPRPGRVKTRLARVIGEEEAARLYRAFLEDSLSAYAGLDVGLRLYVVPPVSGFPRELVPAGASLHEQVGDGLGPRMQRAFEETFEAGHRRAVIVGTDHPSLSPAHLRQAYEGLRREGRVVIGPSRDGGYYLLGMRRTYPELFGGSYSHSGVLRQALERIVRTGALPVILPAWYDVDRPDELARLRKDLEAEPRRAPRTRTLIEEWVDRYPRLLGPSDEEGAPPRGGG